MRHFACLPLFAALLAAPTACDAKKPEPPPQQQAPAPIAQIEGSLDFSEISVGESAAKSLTIKNAGNAPLEISAISYPESLSGPNKPATVSPGGTLAIEVKFSPTKAGTAQGAVAISTNGGKLEVPAIAGTSSFPPLVEIATAPCAVPALVGENLTSIASVPPGETVAGLFGPERLSGYEIAEISSGAFPAFLMVKDLAADSPTEISEKSRLPSICAIGAGACC